MEFLTEHEVLRVWLLEYGSFALFGLLALGIVALPVPDETLMVLAGVLMYKGSLCIPTTVIATIAGSITGITISYIIGRTLGKFILERFGSWVGLTEAKVHQTHEWFDHLGKWALFFGYFIPGIRHLTGIVAGSIMLQYSHFALFAYSGAVLWASTFLCLGYFFGSYWISALEYAEIYVDEIILVALFTTIGYLLFRAYKHK